MARLTWRNVNAPNFNDAIRARQSGASMFDSGIQRIQDTIQGMKDRRNKAASQDAMGQLLAINDRDQLNQAMAGGLESFGLNPGQASDAFMTALQNRGSNLLDQENQEQIMDVRGNQDRRAGVRLGFDRDQNQRQQQRHALDMRTGRADEERAAAAEERAVAQEADRAAKADLVLEEAQFDWANKQEAAEEAEAKEQLQTEIAADVQKSRGQYASPEEAKRSITQRNLDPVVEKEYLAAIDNLPQEYFSTDGENSARQEGVFRTALQGGSVRRSQLEQDIATDGNLGLYNGALENFGGVAGGDMGKAMIDSLRSDIAGDENAEGVLNESAGDIQATYKRYRDDPAYSNISDHLLAQVITNKFKRGGTALWGQVYGSDGIKFDDPGIQDTLDSLSKPGTEDTLQQRAARLDLRKGDIDQYDSTVQSFMDQFEVYNDRGDTQRANQVLAEAARYVQEAGMNGVGMNPNDPSAAMMRQDTMAPSDFLARAARGGPGARQSAEEADPAAALMGSVRPRGRPNIDPRISATNETMAPVGNALRDQLQYGDDMVGDAAALALRTGANVSDLLARGIGMVAPETGSRMLERGDEARTEIDRLAQEGFVPGRASGISELGRGQQRSENPTLNMVREAGLPDEAASQFGSAVSELTRGTDANGQPLPPARRRRLIEQIQELRDRASNPAPIDAILERLVD